MSWFADDPDLQNILPVVNGNFSGILPIDFTCRIAAPSGWRAGDPGEHPETPGDSDHRTGRPEGVDHLVRDMRQGRGAGAGLALRVGPAIGFSTRTRASPDELRRLAVPTLLLGGDGIGSAVRPWLGRWQG